MAVDDAASTGVGTPVDIDVLGNDSDPEGGPLTVTGASDPANGSAAVNPDGTITYTPDPGFSGVDSFTYTVCDSAGACVDATAQVGVDLEPPVPVDVSASTLEETPVTISVLSNDTDPDGPPRTSVTSVTDPASGTASINADWTVTYIPDTDFNGSDTFTYTITDGDGLAASASVTISIIPVNDPPVAVDDTASTVSGGSITVDVAQTTATRTVIR